PESILVKTPRGREEVAARSGRLSLLARQVLILVDGQHTVAELADTLAQPLDGLAFREALIALEHGRYVDRLEEIRSVA
ncbi:MAG: hypothetical protein WD138_03790, partial [Halofilum sp. (in: g-proteobacteria)]